MNDVIIPWELKTITTPKTREYHEKDYNLYELNIKSKTIKILLNPTDIYYIVFSSSTQIEMVIGSHNVAILSRFICRHYDEKQSDIIKLEYCHGKWEQKNLLSLVRKCDTCYWYYPKNELAKCTICNDITCENCMTHSCVNLFI